ncbi:MAG: hypothetical protein ACPGQL_04015 [Thermoplasmatota archaeon]
MALDTQTVLAIASALPLLGLGFFLAVLRPTRSVTFFFGLFAMAWGFQVAAIHIGRLIGTVRSVELAYFAAFAAVPPIILYLGHYLGLTLGRQEGAWVRRASWVASLVAAVVLLAAPRNFIEEVMPPAGPGEAPIPVLGPFALPFSVLLFHGLLLASVLVVQRASHQKPDGVLRHRDQGMQLALVLFVSYAMTNAFLFYAREAPGAVLGLGRTELTVFYGIAVGILLASFLFELIRGDASDVRMLVAYLLPPLVALIEAFSTGGGAFEAYSVGLWRIGTVAIITYTLARYQLFDIDVTVTKTAGQGAVIGALTLVFFVGKEWMEGILGIEGTVPGVLAACAVALALYPAERGVRAITGRILPRLEEEAYLLDRKAQVYKSALEGVLWDGQLTEKERTLLEVLQQKLGLEASTLEDLHVQMGMSPTPQPAMVA